MPTLFPSLEAFVASCAVIAGAQLIYSAAGFGAGMFAMALLAFVLPDLDAAVITLLLLTLLTECAVLTRERRAIRVRLVARLLPGMLVGVPLGAALLALGPTNELKRLLGVVVAGAGGWFLWRAQQTTSNTPASTEPDAPHENPATDPPRQPAWPLASAIGFISGALAGLFGTGGPPVIITLHALQLDKRTFRATLLTYFLIMSFGRALTYLVGGMVTTAHLAAAAWLLPATGAGWLAGMWLHDRISERAFANAVAALLLLLGVALLLTGGRG